MKVVVCRTGVAEIVRVAAKTGAEANLHAVRGRGARHGPGERLTNRSSGG